MDRGEYLAYKNPSCIKKLSLQMVIIQKFLLVLQIWSFLQSYATFFYSNKVIFWIRIIFCLLNAINSSLQVLIRCNRCFYLKMLTNWKNVDSSEFERQNIESSDFASSLTFLHFTLCLIVYINMYIFSLLYLADMQALSCEILSP